MVRMILELSKPVIFIYSTHLLMISKFRLESTLELSYFILMKKIYFRKRLQMYDK